MSEWWTYTLSDFLLFAPKTYYRLFELYNRDLWPGQLAGLALGLAIVVALLRGATPARGREVAAILAACWAWVAGAFLYERYATINWAAVYFAGAFALEALLLVAIGVVRSPPLLSPTSGWAGRVGFLVALFGLVGQPLVGVFAGRRLAELETFAFEPDPTVVATLGILLCATNARYWSLLVIPLAWCATSGAFLLAMGSPEAFVLAAAAIATLVLAVAKRVAPPAEPLPAGSRATAAISAAAAAPPARSPSAPSRRA